jgi:hypothetical protein
MVINEPPKFVRLKILFPSLLYFILYQLSFLLITTACHVEASRSTSNMSNHPQHGAHHNTQNQGSPFPQGPSPGLQYRNIFMNAMLNQFARVDLDGGNMASADATMANQLLIGANLQQYVNANGQPCFAAPGMYSTQPLVQAQLPDNSYNPYPTAMPCFAHSAYPSNLVGGPTIMPYTPDRSYCLPMAHIPQVDHAPFGSTPPQQLLAVDVDIESLLVQHPAIPPAGPAPPRASLRTLDQSLSNPISGNRNVYIGGLHPNTDDITLAAYAARFGKVETSKAIIDTSTGTCKG